MSYSEDDVLHDKKKEMFFIQIKDGAESSDKIAFLQYGKTENPGELELFHTEVPEEFRGRGVAGLLASKSFKELSKSAKLILTCTYLHHYYNKHKDNFKDFDITLKWSLFSQSPTPKVFTAKRFLIQNFTDFRVKVLFCKNIRQSSVSILFVPSCHEPIFFLILVTFPIYFVVVVVVVVIVARFKFDRVAFRIIVGGSHSENEKVVCWSRSGFARAANKM